MITYGTEHLTVDIFETNYRMSQPGDQIVYAVGDIATSRSIGQEGKELDFVAKRAMHLAENGFICLTQRVMPELQFRNGGGRCFEYIATRCQPKTSAVMQSPRSSSRAGVLATA